MSQPRTICFFSRTAGYEWLSNFAPVEVELDGKIYPSVEHAYQAAKTDDPTEREEICMAPTAATAKKLGKKVKVRPGWVEQRVEVMRGLMRQKFAQEPFRSRLLATEDAKLVHNAPWDRFWGSGADGCGENTQGRLTMEIRAALGGNGSPAA